MAEILRTARFVRGGVMIDIGANIGTTSIPRVLLGVARRVYGAEPEPANLACLRRTIADNGLEGLVVVDGVALGDVDGDAQLLRARRLGAHRLVQDDTPRKAIRVPALTLDAWSQRLGPDLDEVTYVKCDTQGWEGHILAGAQRLLRRQTITWEIEIAPALLDAAGTPPDSLYALLAREFRSFVDLRAIGPGAGRQPTTTLASWLARTLGPRRSYTNVLLFKD
jgi:FkbM family methyltransferase